MSSYRQLYNNEKQISIIKGMEKCFEEKWKKLFRKGIYLGELSFFPLFFFFKSNMNRSKRQKKKVILRNILSGNLTINLLINFAFFVLSVKGFQ